MVENLAPILTLINSQATTEGTELTFTLSATDADNDTITYLATNLPSGATFNGTPTESASTDVVITVGDNPTPVDQAQDLIELVVSFNLPQNVLNSYLANLQKVGQFIQEGRIIPALNQLYAFINKVQKDYQKGILTEEEYLQLLSAANALILDLII